MRVRRIVVLVFLLAVAVRGEDLVARAQARLRHGNRRGAQELFEGALKADPSSGPALEALARLDEYRAIEYRLRYLESGVPLDPGVAAEFEEWLAREVHDLPESVFFDA